MNDLLAEVPRLVAGHLGLAAAALVAAVALSLPLAVALLDRPRLEGVVLGVAGVVQTIPSLALLAAMVPLLAFAGLPSIGVFPAFLGLVVYAVLPVLTNAVVGLKGIDPHVIEAARAVGLAEGQILVRVRMPLARPVILAGVRTAMVWTVGAATLSTPIGAPSLGNLIFGGLQTRNSAAILLGAGLAAGLALGIDWLLAPLAAPEGPSYRRLGAGLLLGAVLAAGAGLGEGAREPLRQVRIGSKTFTEQYVLAELLGGLAREAGLAVDPRPSLGSTVAYDALRAGSLDLYVDYSGTVWATIMKRDRHLARQPLLREVRDWLAREPGIELLAALGFENTYAFAARREAAEAWGVRTLDELAPRAPTLALAGDYEFFQRPEWPAVRDAYGLAFARQLQMDPALMYQAVAHREVDLAVAFSTDGRLAAYDLVTLEDPRGAIPPYDAIVLGRKGFGGDFPALATAIRGLEGRIDARSMRRANRAVDLDGASPGEAALRLREGLAAPGD